LTLHIPTLLVALVLGFGLLVLELAIVQRRLLRDTELGTWTLGGVALLCGFVMLGARAVVPLALSVVAGNGLIYLGLMLYARALYRFVGQRAMPAWIAWLAAAGLAGLLWMLRWPTNERTAVVSLVCAALIAPPVLLIVRRGWHAERSLRTVAVTMGLAAMVLLVRAVHAWLAPEEYGSLTQSSLGQGMTFLSSFLFMLGAGFGFVLASHERVTSRMEQLAAHDGLTGCFNRTTTDMLLAHALSRGQRDSAPVAYVLLDLDRFKDVNDRHGHAVGDELLRRFADLVRARLRGSDVFGRVGGEEFGLVLPATDAAGAQRLAEDVRQAVETMDVCDRQATPLPVTVSAGVAVAEPGAPLSAGQLCAQADQALYKAKGGGRNRVVLFAGWAAAA